MGPEQAPTRAAVLELRAERVVVEEAYDFLDEKRLLLAAELLSQLDRYQQLLAELEEKTTQAHQSLVAAVKRHGLQGLSVYPAAHDAHTIKSSERNLMGVTLADTQLTISRHEPGKPLPPSNPSVDARQCEADFRALLESSAMLAGVSGNLYRLFAEYRLTERRARALENVILPDIETSLGRMSAYLEEMDLEDAIRARPPAGKFGSA
jgi:V/A-type H+/Na+-transporting ATPase subunit D